MKHILKEGEISLLFPKAEGGALSGEVHLINHKRNKYVVRRCKTLNKAKYYEFLSSKLEKYGFLPKFLGRYGKDVLYEFIKGRELKEKESLYVFRQLGKIAAYSNKIKKEGNVVKEFNENLRNLVSGKFVPTQKILLRRKRSKVRRMPKKLISKKEEKEIKKIYNNLKLKCKPKIALDVTDFTPGNFKIFNGKVFLVDVESIKTRIKGFGISKFFMKWGKSEKRQKEFIEGYNSISSIKFITENYKNFFKLNFLIQTINFQNHTGKDYREDLKELKEFLKL